ncbi:LysR family transcriptional regulator [Phyllobacterium phragmitis]|uniref:LysR family transcriptional regulator n=1 Tax=Phyllobacterium phragmitis TaxID=2670329 RepID=A0A2S9IRE7_9HYPH|nr:LysR family transcriptional regulator [Phyllobacterium phragmitis]PRD43093.1 LysR family transcriptional regulator [Phyllobacterium phragmitis]
MELRHLRYILASARNGSFSAAGHELNVRQPIVSKRIKEVEDELGGIALFDRSTSGARLTPTGEEFLVSARRIIEDVERLTERAKASAAGKVGRLLVGFYKSLSAGAFRAALHDFREQYPDIEVELVEVPFTELMAGLQSDRIDLAVILGDAGKCKDFASVTLWAERLVVALPECHPLVDRPLIYWPELKSERFLISHHDPGPDIRHILLRHLAAPSDHPEILARHLSRESILSEVADRQGIALQCESAMGLTSLGVVFRPVHDGHGATRLGYIACWKPENTNPVVKTFVDAIKPRG